MIEQTKYLYREPKKCSRTTCGPRAGRCSGLVLGELWKEQLFEIKKHIEFTHYSKFFLEQTKSTRFKIWPHFCFKMQWFHLQRIKNLQTLCFRR